MKFYVCNHCGNIIRYEKDTGVPVMCCGEKMEELIPGTTDAAQEKHVPAIEINGDVVTVRVGEVEHPMEEEHYIEWIAMATDEGNQKVDLRPGDEAKATFEYVKGAKLYAYCNKHLLWKTEVQ